MLRYGNLALWSDMKNIYTETIYKYTTYRNAYSLLHFRPARNKIDKSRYLACIQQENRNAEAYGCHVVARILKQPKFNKSQSISSLHNEGKKVFKPIKYKMSSFKGNENIQKKEGGPDKSFSDNQSHSVTLNELALKARKAYCNFKIQQRSHIMNDINQNEAQII